MGHQDWHQRVVPFDRRRFGSALPIAPSKSALSVGAKSGHEPFRRPQLPGTVLTITSSPKRSCALLAGKRSKRSCLDR